MHRLRFEVSFGRYNEQPPQPRPKVSGTVVLCSIFGVLLLAYAYRNETLGRTSLIAILALIPAIILHEVSHGALANLWGDDTAKRAGRLTLNPLRHVDLFGTLLIPAALVLANFPPFGYAKPVPVNTSRMSRNRTMMVGLIGPITNIVLALVAAWAIRNFVTPGSDQLFTQALVIFGLVNVNLAVFNLIPIPPLDGASVIERFLPARYMAGYYTFRKYAMVLLIVLVLSGAPGLGALFEFGQDQWWKVVLPG